MEKLQAIRVKNLTKLYKLYNRNGDRLREVLHPLRRKYHQEFYALKNLTFEINKGETIGIIGQNGSGKSTLLKLITGVLTPTSGTLEVDGKISSLLELGTGFNPDLTGMENIYLFGTINGMAEHEIELILDQILSFADIGDFILQPVKSYSSGMFVRLAFACAINVEPDILIIDEALAVGDARFQKKCYKKIKEFKDRGKTIILVTHDSGTVRTFTDRAIFISKGEMVFFGNSDEAVLRYLNALHQADAVTLEDLKEDTTTNALALSGVGKKSYGKGGAQILEIRLSGLKDGAVFHGGEIIDFQISFNIDPGSIREIAKSDSLVDNLIIGLTFETSKHEAIFGFNTDMQNVDIPIDNKHNLNVVFRFKLPEVRDGSYFFSPAIALGKGTHYTILAQYEDFMELRCQPNDKRIFGFISVIPEITCHSL